jgi:hypothetical protein
VGSSEIGMLLPQESQNLLHPITSAIKHACASPASSHFRRLDDGLSVSRPRDTVTGAQAWQEWYR